MKTSYIVGILLLVLVGGGLLFWSMNRVAPAAVVSTTTVPGSTGVTNTTTGSNPVASATTITTTITSTTTTVANPKVPLTKTVLVNYTSSGFSPKTVIINKGDSINFTAASGAGQMWIASDSHPNHQGYDGTTRDQHCAPGYNGPTPFDQCHPGAQFSFTFQKVGTWGYHNHLSPNNTGSITVK